MHETAFSFSRLESHASGAVLAPGQHILGGWVMPRPGGHFVDVRARLGGRIFPGILGWPRADLAAHFQTGRAVALAEFKIVVELPPGASDLVLEVLEIEGRWSEFQTIRLTADGALPPVEVAMPSGPPLRWHEYGRALQLLLWAARRESARPLAALAHELVASLPWPRDLRHPHPPFKGHLDEPAAVTRSGFGRVPVLGYLFHETLPIKRVLATFDLQVWQTIGHGLPSPGPASYYPQFPTAARCGLYGVIDAPAQLPAPLCLRLYAELPDGSLHLCSVQRGLPFTNEEEKSPYPARADVTVADAHEILQQALAGAGRPLIRDAEFAGELARIEADFARRAPARIIAVPPLAPAPHRASAPLPRSALLVTHNLNHEGAPLFFLDYARHLAAQGVAVTILSPEDGPLRARFAEFARAIRLVDAGPVFAATDAGAARAALDAVARAVDFPACDLVVCNTFTTFWAVHAAKAAGRRVLLYVHESTTPASFYVGRVSAAVVTLAEQAFGLADCVSFTTAATRRYHCDYDRPENHRLTPGWIEVARLDAWRAQHPRSDLRDRFHLRPGELLVTNVGTVCDRKGQHIFARAVDLLWRRHPALAARTRFVMLGGGDTPFDAVLADLLSHIDRPNLEVHPASADYLPYYAAADLFVCSTYEESSPRVILEAMVCEVPLLSSGVQGVPEQARDSLEATLIPPGDTVALCEGMARLLLSPGIGRDLAARARARVVAEFDAALLLPRHAALAAEIARHAPGP
ncbi:MAG: glycosyltransferase family 4 protein [Opitutaceae bacterium]|nr:glycosyltransferase family 4 protein [Opitutaceae bacterium]